MFVMLQFKSSQEKKKINTLWILLVPTIITEIWVILYSFIVYSYFKIKPSDSLVCDKAKIAF